MAADVAVQEPVGGLGGDVPGGDHGQLEVAVDGAAIDPLGLDQRDAGEQILHIEGRPQHQHRAVAERGQPLLELAQAGRRPGGLGIAGGDGAEDDDLSDPRPAERVGDGPAHPRPGGGELRVGDDVGEQHQGRLGVLEQHPEAGRVGQVAGHDLGPAPAELLKPAPVLQRPHRPAGPQEPIGHLAADVPGSPHHRDHRGLLSSM